MELWDAYDERFQKTGETLVRGEPIPAGRYHLVVHAWFMNSRGEILLQRRSLEKPLRPGLWACVCGSALQGETPEDAILREVQEEMGFTPDFSRAVLINRSLHPESHLFVYFFRQDVPLSALTLQKEEVMDAKYVSLDALLAMDEQTLWHFSYFQPLFQLLPRLA